MTYRAIHMLVTKYVPRDQYGFCSDEQGGRVFFHLSRFHDNVSPLRPPLPPIIGEKVEVSIPTETDPSISKEMRAVKAERVTRLSAPNLIEGVVAKFDPGKGYGFINGEDGVSYYLHRVEVLHGKLPGRNMRVRFVSGSSRGKPRACHVEILARS